MARCEEEFNPWPSFVDIFSSVILVMLLFLLVTLVNLGYYAQFKFKISYTGSIATDDLILNDNPAPIKIKEKIVIEKQLKTKQEVQQTVQNLQNQVESLQEKLQEQQQQQQSQSQAQAQQAQTAEAQKKKELESPGLDLADKSDDKKKSKQKIIEKDNYFIITYKGNEIFVDDAINKKIKAFIKKVKEKIGEHKVYISAVDPEDQISATIAKQISLGRTISTRNLIRKFGYKKKDVRVDLLKEVNIKENVDKKNGYIIIRVKK